MLLCWFAFSFGIVISSNMRYYKYSPNTPACKETMDDKAISVGTYKWVRRRLQRYVTSKTYRQRTRVLLMPRKFFFVRLVELIRIYYLKGQNQNFKFHLKGWKLFRNRTIKCFSPFVFLEGNAQLPPTWKMDKYKQNDWPTYFSNFLIYLYIWKKGKK